MAPINVNVQVGEIFPIDNIPPAISTVRYKESDGRDKNIILSTSKGARKASTPLHTSDFRHYPRVISTYAHQVRQEVAALLDPNVYEVLVGIPFYDYKKSKQFRSPTTGVLRAIPAPHFTQFPDGSDKFAIDDPFLRSNHYVNGLTFSIVKRIN